MARKKKSKGLRVSLMLTVGLMIVSFAAGRVTPSRGISALSVSSASRRPTLV